MTKIASSRPVKADPQFDCAWRKYAYDYAGQIQPWLVGDSVKSKQLYDALELDALCSVPYRPITPPADSSTQQSQSHAVIDAGGASITVFVDPNTGKDDSGSGSMGQPFKTIGAAIDYVRDQRSTAPPGTQAAVMLREGLYYLSSTISLTAADSFLTIAAYNGEKAVVSGARKVEGLTWEKASFGSNIYSVDLSGVDLPNGMTAMQYGNASEPSRATLARYPNADPEVDLFPKGYVTAKTSWSPPIYDGSVCDPHKQCGPSTTVTHSVPESEWHGMYQNWTTGIGGSCDVYTPPRSPWCSDVFYLERQFPEMHTRHPSGMFNVSLGNGPYAHPEGAIVNAWRPGHWYTWMFEVASGTSTEPTVGWTFQQNMNNVFSKVPVPKQDSDEAGYLGTFNTAQECWAACNASKIKCSDFTWHQLDFNDPAWRGGCYFTYDGEWSPTQQANVISAHGPQSFSAFEFGAGGNQGGEGNEGAGEWFVEGVKEELDNPNEFWFDKSTHTLFFSPNSTSGPPSTIFVPTLANLIEIQGSQAMPVKQISVQGIQVISNRPTYMEPRTNPSGGDWALERMGAVFLEGTEGVSIANCTFAKLDSNAIFLSGYNQNASIIQNSFRWLGQNCIASWGRPIDNDGTNGDFPRYTLVEGNFAHEIGHRQKQSSFYFQAETAQVALRNNIVFNIPRAAINFNDGFGGGAELTQNLLFNSCRESSDHGAFNSWDRLPYYTTVRNGTASTIPAFNNVHRNFIVANYAADGGCLDNDDGSSYYDIHHNFCVYGGHKSDFDGNSKYSRFNIHAYASVYGGKCLGILAQVLPPQGYNEEYSNNVCILNDGDSYLDVGGLQNGVKCLDGSDLSQQTFNNGLQVLNNTIYSPNKSPPIKCGGKSVTLQQFQSMGYDKMTTTSTSMPSADTIIQWAKSLLANQN